jgi:arabinose-5-phosphate isomerase
VLDGKGALAGIVTDGDIRRHYDSGFAARRAGEVMTRDPQVTYPDLLAAEALAVMTERKITQLIVLDPEDAARRPVGVLHIHDCLRAGPGQEG